MPEVADAGKDHGYAKLVGGGDDVLISYRAAGLNDRSGSGLGYGFKAVGKWEEGIRGGDAALERQDSLHGAKAGGVYAAHLAGADAESLGELRLGAGIDDGVRLDVLANAPGKEKAAQFFVGGWALGYDLEFGGCDVARVGVLQEQPT